MAGSLVYDWDNNCQRIHDRLHNDISHIRWETGELEHTSPHDQRILLYYFKKWHYNNQLFTRLCEETSTRKTVIDSLNRKGYGVSTALAGDMESIQKNEIPDCLSRLTNTFNKALDMVKSQIYMPPEQISNRNSSYILRELCKRLGENYEQHLASVTPAGKGSSPALHTVPITVFHQIQKEMPPRAHISIMNRMFLELTEESSTIMEGTIGEVNVDPPQYLKFLASRNLRELFNYLYDTIDQEFSIDIEWIKRIHHFLTRELDTSHNWRAGEFRQEDFEDRSGLTLEFGNFQRGLQELGNYLQRVNWKTESLHSFTANLAKLYYMLLGIHPFTDSNGRTAKCLINHLMMRRGLPPLIFEVYDEILYLPRYGGSSVMMTCYFQDRMAVSIERYIHEKDMICHFGNLEKHFFKVDFDAGMYFRHLNGMFSLIEVDFKVYLIPEESPLYGHYFNQCKIVLPGENLLNSLVIFYGFTREGQRDWNEEGELRPAGIWKRGFDSHGVPCVVATCFIQVSHRLARYETLEISAGCPDRGLFFTNKSLNYRYQMDRPHLIRLLGDFLSKRIMSGEVQRDAELGPIRRLRDHLEHRSLEIIREWRIEEAQDLSEVRPLINERHREEADLFRYTFIPSLFQLVHKYELTGKSDPAEYHNMQLLHYCTRRMTPNTERIFGYP